MRIARDLSLAGSPSVNRGRLEGRRIVRTYGIALSTMSSTFRTILSARVSRVPPPGTVSSAPEEEEPAVPLTVCEDHDIEEKEPPPP
jgi:hypothetical protein